MAGLVHRWRTGDQLRQQQLLWFGAAFALPALFLPLIATDLAQPWMFALVTLPVPVAIGVAVLQRRLYDLQQVAAQTLTYAGLSGAVALLYAATVASVGAILDERGASWLPWLAAGVVAVTFAPLRNALQRAVTRLTYGQWDRPAEVLGATAPRLADATDVPTLLDTLVSELGRTLRLSHVEIASSDGRTLASSTARIPTHAPRSLTGTPPTGTSLGRPALTETPLTAYGSPVGVLRWASDHPLRERDRHLVEDVAHQLGGVVHAAALVDTLRDAQHHLVIAREEERRRLRRDLHDGLGPELGSLSLRVDELRNRWPTLADPDAGLLELRSAVQDAIRSVRSIVEGLRPAPLDELGLGLALEHLALRSPPGLQITVDAADLPALPAAVEVAVYRITQEALSNASRHSGAAHVSVQVHLEHASPATGLVLEVRDDGRGGVTPRPGGMGLLTTRGRAEELGGRLVVEDRAGGGTVLRLRLPLDVPTRGAAA